MVNYIFYKGRTKMMCQVTSKEEFCNMRNSDHQKQLVDKARGGNRQAKMRLLQFNYSCLPTPEGRLKGATQPSNSVGMDIDILRYENEDENEYQKRLDKVPEMVMAKKDELHLLLLERSVSKGFHIVFRRRPELSQEDNLRWASDLLGVAYDKGAKDITRVFFATTANPSDLIFLDDELFKVESPLPVPPKGNDEPASCILHSASKINPTSCILHSASYQGIPYSKIIDKYFDLFHGGRQPSEGNRNVMTYELALTLRPICDYDQQRLEQVIPNYWGTKEGEEERAKAIASALKEPRKGMPYRLNQVLKSLHHDSRLAATGGTSEMPPPLPQKLPPLLELLSRNVPPLYKAAVCESVFPSLATHFHGVKFRYIDNKDHEPTFMNVLIAPMSIGKGCIKPPIDYIMADIKAADQVNREREAEWKRKNPAGKTRAKDPRPEGLLIQMLIDNLTDAVFNQRVVDAHKCGQRFIYTRVDEVEQLKRVTSRGTVDEVSTLIRNAFDNADHGQERVGSDSITGIAPLRWNFNASTTIPNAHRFFAKACNDGTLSRLYLSTIIKPETDDDEIPVFGIYDEQYALELKPFIDLISNAGGRVECPEAEQLAREIAKENNRNASLLESDAFRRLSYRANVIAYLKGMLLYVANDYKWTKEISDYVRWSEQMDLWCKMRFFGQQLEKEIAAEQQQIFASPLNLLEQLPEVFTTEQFLQLRQKLGRTGNGQATLRSWKHRGYIDFDELSNTWKKT